MTTQQENKLNMFLALRDFLLPNSSVTKDLPGFEANLSALQETIVNLQSIAEQQKFDKTGITKKKNELKNTVVILAADNSRRITAYGKLSKNSPLETEARYTHSELRKSTDVALKDYAQIIYDKGQQHIEALAPYGITPDSQKTFLDAINAFNASIGGPRVGITEKSQATKQLALLFGNAESILADMDSSADILRLSNVNFHNGYRSVRKLVESHTGSLSLKAEVTDMASGWPVKGVEFRFQPAPGSERNGNNVEIVKKSGEKGRFNVKNIPSGTYQVAISKPGFKNQIQSVSIADNEMSEMFVELERA
jgi:hypothetical protein